MIAIVNVSTGPVIGWQNYELRINSHVVATFRHKREEGLAKCLQAAAAAYEKKKWEDIAHLLGNDGDGLVR